MQNIAARLRVLVWIRENVLRQQYKSPFLSPTWAGFDAQKQKGSDLSSLPNLYCSWAQTPGGGNSFQTTFFWSLARAQNHIGWRLERRLTSKSQVCLPAQFPLHPNGPLLHPTDRSQIYVRKKLHSLPVNDQMCCKDRRRKGECHIASGVRRATGGGTSPTWEDTEV